MYLLVDHCHVGTELQALHDQLLAEMPEGAHHETCPMCETQLDPTTGGDPHMSDKTVTQDDLDAAKAEADQAKADLAAAAERETELAAELEAAKAKLNESEVGKAVSAAVAEKDTEIADLQSKLDTAEAERQAATKALDDFKAEVEAKETAAADFTAYLERAKARQDALKDSELYSDEHIAENLPRFTAMDDEQFEASIADVKTAIAARTGEPIPKATSMKASADSDTTTSQGKTSVLSTIGAMRRDGKDFRTL